MASRRGRLSSMRSARPRTCSGGRRTVSALSRFFQSKAPFDPTHYELKQVFFESKDGTRVPMFIAGAKGLKTDGTARLLMTGYGGFNLSILPAWNPAYAWW